MLWTVFIIFVGSFFFDYALKARAWNGFVSGVARSKLNKTTRYTERHPGLTIIIIVKIRLKKLRLLSDVSRSNSAKSHQISLNFTRLYSTYVVCYIIIRE